MNPQKIRGKGTQRAVWLPRWAADMYREVARALNVSEMEVTRTILVGAAILPPAGLRAEYFRVKELITREQAAHTGMHRKGVEEPVPPDATETIGVKPDAPTD